MVGDVGLGQFLGRAGQNPGHVDGHVADADDRDIFGVEVEMAVAEIGVAVEPGHELGRGVAIDQVFAGDPHSPVRLGPGGEGHGVVVPPELVDGNVPPDLDVAEESESGAGGDFVETPGHRLDLLVVGRDAEPHQPVGHREPFVEIHGDGPLGLAQELLGQEEARGTGAHDGDAESGCHSEKVSSELPLAPCLKRTARPWSARPF